MQFKKFSYGAYAIAASLFVVGGFVGFWILLTTTDTALIPVAGTGVPVPVPIPTAETVRTITVNGNVIRVTTVDTPETRQKGLGGRNGLAPDEGMLFIFPEDGKYGFWMKNMKFPIDILWLSSARRIVYMAQSVSPDTYPQVFTPAAPARYVLELPAGYVKAYTVEVGDEVRF